MRLAKAWESARGGGAVVINADSAQVYADLRVLSARPDEEEMQGVPHRLFGTWDGAQACSAVDWAEKAKAEIAIAHAAGALPVLVGGTGMYLQVLLDGIAPIPPIDPDIRAEIRAMDVSQAYAALSVEDPERAAKLAPLDSQRIARALEVVRSTGVTLGEWQKRKAGSIAGDIDLHPLVLLPEREWLYDRCDRRLEIMAANGAVAEVEALLARKLDPDLPVMRAIGVREFAGFGRGECTLEEAIALGQQSTRNFAKRQYTWFRNQPPPEWPRIDSRTVDIRAQFDILFHD